MGSDEVEEEHEHGNEIVCGLEGRKTLFRLVPRFELLVEAFNEVVGDFVFEALDTDVPYIREDGFNRCFVRRVAIRDDGVWFTEAGSSLQHSKGLR